MSGPVADGEVYLTRALIGLTERVKALVEAVRQLRLSLEGGSDDAPGSVAG